MNDNLNLEQSKEKYFYEAHEKYAYEFVSTNLPENNISHIAIPIFSSLRDLSLDEKANNNESYKDLSNFVTIYNQDKTEDNLNKILFQIGLLKENLSSSEEEDYLVCIANEAILYKSHYLLEKLQFEFNIEFCRELPLISNSKDDSLSLIHLNDSIKQFNNGMSKDNVLHVIRNLYQWMNEESKEYRAKFTITQYLIRCLSCGILNKDLFLLFNILNNESNEKNLIDLLLLKKNICNLNSNIFNKYAKQLPELKTTTKNVGKLALSISSFNKNQTVENFKNVANELFEYRFTHYKEFKQNNVIAIIKVMQDILAEQTIQVDIRKTDEFILLLHLKNNDKHLAPYIWEAIHIPDEKNQNSTSSIKKTELLDQINKFNEKTGQLNGDLLHQVINHFLEWMEIEPIEFRSSGWIEIIYSIKNQFIKNLILNDFDLDQWKPSEALQSLQDKIKKHNILKCKESFMEATKQLYNWEQEQNEEFNFFQGLLLKNQIETKRSQNFSYSPIQLPSSHPSVVFEQNLDHDPSKDLNSYILTFHNSIAPWSHTEIVFVTKAKPNNPFSKDPLQAEFNIEYKGLGTETDNNFFNKFSHYAEGVHIVDDVLIKRMNEIINYRKDLIEKTIFSVLDGGCVGLTTCLGEDNIRLHTNDQIRHFRVALIDNFLTNNRNLYFQNMKESRYRFDLYKSGNKLYKKWVEDVNGQFEHNDAKFTRNPYFLSKKGKLVSGETVKRLYSETYQIGNFFYAADGKTKWQNDYNFGQYRFDKENHQHSYLGPRYSRTAFEHIFAHGEMEWCSSYAVRMLHSAYAYVHMPQFEWALNKLEKSFYLYTDIEGKNSTVQMERRHATILVHLADQFARKMVESNAGKQYFRDMNKEIKINPRITPDTLLKALHGRAPGIINSITRSLKTVRFTIPKNYSKNCCNYLAIGCATVSLGLISIPGATLKLAFNVSAATAGLFPDIVISATEAYESKKVQFEKDEEAGISHTHTRLKLAGQSAYGLIVQGFGKRFFGDYIGLIDIKEALVCRKKSFTPFSE